MAVHYVAEINEIPEGTLKIVDVKGFSIGIYNVKGEFHALNNYCPHQGAKLCKGLVSGTNLESEVYQYIYGREQEIVRCPWHGWEFDIKTGKSLFNDKVRTKKFQVVIEGEKLGLVIGV